MADYIDCSTKGFPILGVLKSMFNTVDANSCTTFRIKLVTYASCDVITCASKQEFETLLRQSIIIASDSKPAIRVCITSYASGAGLSDIDCGNFTEIEVLAGLTFCKDSNGDVAINLASIT